MEKEFKIRNTEDIVVIKERYIAPSGVRYADVIRKRDNKLIAVPCFDLVEVDSPYMPYTEFEKAAYFPPY